MADINTAKTIWIVTQTAARPMLAAGLAGTLEPIRPAPLLNPAAYIESWRADDITAASAKLGNLTAPLMYMMESPDGEPAARGLLFTHRRDMTISYQDGGRSFHGHYATEYEATGSPQEYGWEADIAQETFGAFLIGAPPTVEYMARSSRPEGPYWAAGLHPDTGKAGHWFARAGLLANYGRTHPGGSSKELG